ncbi:MAG: diadenylate cyclase CdaA [Candidatus Izemoplasmataceae bacterium]
MENLDLLLIQIYALAIFATLVKQKTTANVYRLLKFFVVGNFIVYAYFLMISFDELNWFTELFKIIPLLLLVMIIVQTEVRLVLKFFGLKSGLLLSNTIEEEVKVELVKAIDYLSDRKIGALITFERAMNLDDFIATAFKVNAPITAELLQTIFIPKTPLHDGAVIIKDSQIVCAGTYFPPSENPDIPKYLGSRHRAAIGISEVTDSLTVIVSEQTGYISVAIDGYLDRDISKESLLLYFEKYLQN